MSFNFKTNCLLICPNLLILKLRIVDEKATTQTLYVYANNLYNAKNS